MQSRLPCKDCSICIRRRIKCDRGTPGCDKCASRSLECPGYDTSLRWRPSKKYSYSNKKFIFPGIQPWPPSGRAKKTSTLLGERYLLSLPSSLEHPVVRRLLHHYSQVISTQLAWVESSNNPWRHVILPLAIESPSLLSAIMALAAGDLSEKYTHNQTEFLESRNRYYDEALLLSSKHLKSVRETATYPSNEPPNPILATVIILCFLEIKWPQSGLYRVHLQAAQALITHWENFKGLLHDPDTTTIFLIQELSAASALASVTSFDDENETIESILLGDNFTHDGNAGLVEFLYIIQLVTKMERRKHLENRLGLPSSTVDLDSLLHLILQARNNAAHCGSNMASTPQFRRDFRRVIEMFYHACIIYTHRSLTRSQVKSKIISLSCRHLFSSLREIENISPFAQDLVWPVFIAGTECAGTVADEEYIYTCLKKIIQLDGLIDRPRAIEFLQSLWLRGDKVCWIQVAREWANEDRRFFVM